MKLLIHKYSAAIEQCYIDVANRDESTLPLVDPQTPPPSHHPIPSFIPSKVSEVPLSPVEFQVEEGPQLLFGGRSTLEEKEGGATQQYFERNGDMTTLPLLVAPVVTVPGFGDGSVKPNPAPNWSELIQQLEARRYLPFSITMGDKLEVDGTAPPFAPKWIDRRGTRRPPPAPNWISRGIVRPPPAPNWHFNKHHRSHLLNKLPVNRRLYYSASMEHCLVCGGVLAQRYSVLVFMVIVLRVLERIGILIFTWFAAYASGLGVHLLVSSGTLSTLSLVLVYLFTPFSTAINYWQSGFCLHGASSICFFRSGFPFLGSPKRGGVTDIVVEII